MLQNILQGTGRLPQQRTGWISVISCAEVEKLCVCVCVRMCSVGTHWGAGGPCATLCRIRSTADRTGRSGVCRLRHRDHVSSSRIKWVLFPFTKAQGSGVWRCGQWRREPWKKASSGEGCPSREQGV